MKTYIIKDNKVVEINQDEKNKLIELFAYMNKEQIKKISELINLLRIGHMTKGNLMSVAYNDNCSGIDSALPMDHVKNIKKIQPNFDTFFHCYNYQDNNFGKLENIAEALLVNLINEFKK